MLSDDFPEMGGAPRSAKALGGSPVTIHLDVPDVDALWARTIAAGAHIAMPLGDMFWGDRYGVITDPFGHRWSLATRKQVASDAQLKTGVDTHFSTHR